MDEISLKALAKINLGLDVLGKREDGYHEVRMVMQTIHLYDRVEIKKTRSPHIHVETNLYYLPVNEDNLVYRAAKLMKDEFQIKEGVRIVLQKFIPVAAGLAGGSSDAAAVLVGMNRIFNPCDTEDRCTGEKWSEDRSGYYNPAIETGIRCCSDYNRGKYR